MKITLIFISIGFGIISWGQNVPNAATEDFKERIPQQADISSSWEEVENGFKVTYSSEKANGILYYDDNGSFRSSMDETNFENLREEVKVYIESNFKVKKVKQCYLLNSGTAPERCVVTLKQKSKLVTLYFRPNGDFHYQE